MTLVRPSGEIVKFRWFDARDNGGNRTLLFECSHFKEGRCGIYKDRPKLCRKFKCEALKGEVKLGAFLRAHLPFKHRRKVNVTRRLNAMIRKSLAAKGT